MARGDNKCPTCGEWAGVGHECDTATPIARLTASVAPSGDHPIVGTRNVTHRLDRASTVLDTLPDGDRQEADQLLAAGYTGRLFPGWTVRGDQTTGEPDRYEQLSAMMHDRDLSLLDQDDRESLYDDVYRLVEDPDTSPEVLHFLATTLNDDSRPVEAWLPRDQEETLTYAIVRHPNITPATIQYCVTRFLPTHRRANPECARILDNALTNDQVTGNADLFRSLASSVADFGKTSARRVLLRGGDAKASESRAGLALTHPDPRVRVAAVRFSSHFPAGIGSSLAADPDARVRREHAQRVRRDPSLAADSAPSDQRLFDANPQVRRDAVSTHRLLPDAGALAVLANDPDPTVRAAVRQRVEATTGITPTMLRNSGSPLRYAKAYNE